MTSRSERLPVVLSIAGSDSSAGAGVQADLKTASALGAYAATAVTAVTAQNTLEVTGIEPLSPALVRAQIDAVFADLEVAAVKVGLLPNPGVAAAVAEALGRWTPALVVVDPVSAATTGRALQSDGVNEILLGALGPFITVLTPNLVEAEVLSGHGPIRDEAGLARAGRALLDRGPRHVLCKGGHLDGPEAVDLLVTEQGCERFAARRLAGPGAHGTGCTLSSAIAVGLAKGYGVSRAVREAKAYLQQALAEGGAAGLGRGTRPVDHFYALRSGADGTVGRS